MSEIGEKGFERLGKLGSAGSKVGAHCVIEGDTTIGEDNHILTRRKRLIGLCNQPLQLRHSACRVQNEETTADPAKVPPVAHGSDYLRAVVRTAQTCLQT